MKLWPLSIWLTRSKKELASVEFTDVRNSVSEVASDTSSSLNSNSPKDASVSDNQIDDAHSSFRFAASE